MQHLKLAFDLIVIMIGLGALFACLSWALRTREAMLRNFLILYALFTLVLIMTLVLQYLTLNVGQYSARTWYWMMGLLQALNFSVIVALINFLLAAYQVKYSRIWMIIWLAAMLIGLGLAVSPIGAVLDADRHTIHLGPGMEISSGLYLAAFAFALVLGWGWLHRLWKTDRRLFVVGLMIFSTVGFIESIGGFSSLLHTPESSQASGGSFMISSIAYGLYGIFVIVFFLRYFVPASVQVDPLFEAFIARHGITGREREIILMVFQGRSNPDIARELVISLATVKTHLHNIYGKLGVKSRYDLLARVRSGQ